MRLIHLYTGLFLVPWMVVYGLSALFLSHHQGFRTLFGVEPPKWEQVREVDFKPPGDWPSGDQAQAERLLEALDLTGAFRVEPQSTAQELRVLRISGSGNYRVIWRPEPGQLRVMKQQPGSFYRFVHFLHFRHGYAFSPTAYLLWGVTVDLVAVSILFWVFSGVYLWACQPRHRMVGGLLLGSGLVLFALLAWALYQ